MKPLSKKQIKKTKFKKIKVLVLLLVIIFIFSFYQIIYLKEAHRTFENYYIFRGCTQLFEKTDSYGICKTNSGQIIKIVKYQNKWYLDSDLPCGFLCF
jgi:hypothetical protein